VVSGVVLIRRVVLVSQVVPGVLVVDGLDFVELDGVVKLVLSGACSVVSDRCKKV